MKVLVLSGNLSLCAASGHALVAEWGSSNCERFYIEGCLICFRGTIVAQGIKVVPLCCLNAIEIVACS